MSGGVGAFGALEGLYATVVACIYMLYFWLVFGVSRNVLLLLVYRFSILHSLRSAGPFPDHISSSPPNCIIS